MDEQNYISLARTAERGRNYDEARRYFMLSLETNPRNVEAWIGKARAATWLDNLFEEGVKDAIASLEQAIELGLTGENQQEAAKVAYLMVDFYFNRAEKVYRRLLIGGSDTTQQRMYLEGVVQLTGRELLRLAWQLEKSTEHTKELIKICNSYRKTFGSYAGDFIDRVMQECSAWVRENDPTNAATLPRPSAKPTCFIATASCGSQNDPRVLALQEFRDNWLLKRESGRLFINLYYGVSPPLARIIGRSALLQNLSCTLVVSPLYLISKCLMAKTDIERRTGRTLLR